MSATREQRRASHPEVDWQCPITFGLADDEAIHPRSTGRNYANSVAPKPCICGCPTTAHNFDTGECLSCGCEWLQVVYS